MWVEVVFYISQGRKKYKPNLFSASTNSSGSGEALRKCGDKRGEECIFITSNDGHVTISTTRLLWLY
jgi:hypothetical protein